MTSASQKFCFISLKYNEMLGIEILFTCILNDNSIGSTAVILG